MGLSWRSFLSSTHVLMDLGFFALTICFASVSVEPESRISSMMMTFWFERSAGRWLRSPSLAPCEVVAVPGYEVMVTRWICVLRGMRRMRSARKMMAPVMMGTMVRFGVVSGLLCCSRRSFVIWSAMIFSFLAIVWLSMSVFVVEIVIMRLLREWG